LQSRSNHEMEEAVSSSVCEFQGLLTTSQPYLKSDKLSLTSFESYVPGSGRMLPNVILSRLNLWRRWRGELCKVREAERSFDIADLFDGIFISIFAELLLLDLFELIAHLVELIVRERRFPCGENDRVLARGVILVHQHESLQRFR